MLNLGKVIQKAKEAGKHAGENFSDHFPEIRKMILMPKGAEKEIAENDEPANQKALK